MYGVVIWSDVSAKTAVVWCEDRGELAYFDATLRPTKTPQGYVTNTFFAPGDYIQFDSEMDGELRRAYRAQLVETSSSARLPDTAAPLTVSGIVVDASSADLKPDPAQYAGCDQNVVQFARR